MDCAAFGEAFECVFTRTSDDLGSSRGKRHWVDVEYWKDKIAGPLYSIAQRGGCAYVYAGKNYYFTGVNDPESLRARLLEWHADFAKRVEQFVPTSEIESHDLESMRSRIARIREVIEAGIKIETERWQNSLRDRLELGD